ncbi:hypothetical protein [Rhodococcus sp. NBC_00294]|uniref:hypothetical protein n=1 Tax=Rhodococcus sp. NBC_00294 TaxID=2976004 RepID=UPI003FA73668
MPYGALPPIRTLAAELAINCNTVATAYKQLVSAGISRTGHRAGTVITELPMVVEEARITPRTLDLASGNPDVRLLPDLPAAVAATSATPALYGATAASRATKGVHSTVRQLDRWGSLRHAR